MIRDLPKYIYAWNSLAGKDLYHCRVTYKKKQYTSCPFHELWQAEAWKAGALVGIKLREAE